MPIHHGDIDRSGLTGVTVDPGHHKHMAPCQECAGWFVTVDRYRDLTVVYEWHDKTCPNLATNG